jgi:hypothetical protein
MPFTPFHFGPGALVHSAAPKHISFLAFCDANVLVDVEPLYYMLTGGYPIHRFFLRDRSRGGLWNYFRS